MEINSVSDIYPMTCIAKPICENKLSLHLTFHNILKQSLPKKYSTIRQYIYALRQKTSNISEILNDLFSFVGFWRLKVHRIREHRSPLNCEECGQLFKVLSHLRSKKLLYNNFSLYSRLKICSATTSSKFTRRSNRNGLMEQRQKTTTKTRAFRSATSWRTIDITSEQFVDIFF